MEGAIHRSGVFPFSIICNSFSEMLKSARRLAGSSEPPFRGRLMVSIMPTRLLSFRQPKTWEGHLARAPTCVFCLPHFPSPQDPNPIAPGVPNRADRLAPREFFPAVPQLTGVLGPPRLGTGVLRPTEVRLAPPQRACPAAALLPDQHDP
jgi:hypothetical protein